MAKPQSDEEAREIASCMLGSITDYVKLSLARDLVESIEATNTDDALQRASKALFEACNALCTEFKGEAVGMARATQPESEAQ